MGAPLIHFFSFSLLTQVEGFSHLEIIASSSSHGSSSIGDSLNTYGSNSSSSSSSIDDGMQEMFANMDRQKQCASVVIVVANSFNMFNANELKEGVGHSMDLGVGVRDVLAIMQATPRSFKTSTNFTLAEFDKLALLIASTIVCHA